MEPNHDDILVDGSEKLTYSQDKYSHIKGEINKNKSRNSLLNILDKTTNTPFTKSTMSKEEIELATDIAAQEATTAERYLADILKTPEEERIKTVKKLTREPKAKEIQSKDQRARDRYRYNRLNELTKQILKSGVSDISTAEDRAREELLIQDRDANKNYTEYVLEQRFKEEQECSCVIM